MLSIAAPKMGAERVYGFDNDPFSVKNARENIKINSVGDRVAIEEEDLKTVKIKPCNFLLANMISSIIVPNLSIFRAFLKPDGTVIFSGILAGEEAMFADSLGKEKFRLIKVTRRGEWIAAQAGV